VRATTRFLVAIAITTAMLAGCGRREAPPAPRPSPPPAVRPPAAPAVSAEQYVKLESSRSLLVVRASELAMNRSANGRIKTLASRLRDDHNGIAAQLNMAGRRLNLLPSASLLTTDQNRLDGLSQAADFDAAYVRTIRAVVEACRDAHAAYAEGGASPTLRPVARFAASTCADELRSL
jgi:putative membrane protein